MRNLLAIVVLVLSMNACARRSGPKALSSQEPGVQMRHEFLSACNAKDVDAVAALYAEEATLVSDGGTFKGRKEIRKWVQAGLDQGSRLETIEPDIEKSSGMLAYGTGRTIRLVGSEVHFGQYLIVMEKIGAEWKIVQHFSLNAGKNWPGVISRRTLLLRPVRRNQMAHYRPPRSLAQTAKPPIRFRYERFNPQPDDALNSCIQNHRRIAMSATSANRCTLCLFFVIGLLLGPQEVTCFGCFAIFSVTRSR